MEIFTIIAIITIAIIIISSISKYEYDSKEEQADRIAEHRARWRNKN